MDRNGRKMFRGLIAMVSAAYIFSAAAPASTAGWHHAGEKNRAVAGYGAERRTRYAEAASGNEKSDESFAEQVLALVNHERDRKGIAPLRLSRELMEAAAIRADEITQVFSHTRPNGKPCSSLIADGAYTVGENIAAGLAAPEDVVAQWMDSPGHRANILNPDYTELGVGYTYRQDSEYRHYWVQMFRRPMEKAIRYRSLRF